MASVWFIGNRSQRILSAADWANAGITGVQQNVWSVKNGWSIPESAFTSAQLLILEQNPEFQTGSPDGPRVRTPDVSYPSPSESEIYYALIKGMYDYIIDNGLNPEDFVRVGDIADLIADALAASTDIVRTAGNQTIDGNKSFIGDTNTRNLFVNNNPGDTARVVLGNTDANQIFEFGTNVGGNFNVWDSTNSKGPFTIQKNSPNGALTVETTQNTMGQMLNMLTKKIINLADPTNPQDAATRAFVLAQIAGFYTKPGSGIPSGDLAAAVVASLNLANSALQASNIGVANGVAGLDGAGKVPLSQLPASLMTYQGTWNPSTNTPTLADGVGDLGDVWKVAGSAGSVDFGSGAISFDVGDYVIYNNSGKWEKSDTTDAVSRVAGLVGDITAASLRTALSINNVDNTSDVNKPVSTAVSTLLTSTYATISSLTSGLSGKQAQSAVLDAIATVSAVANKIVYFNGTNTAATTDLSSFGRSLIDDADAAAARATLALGAAAVKTANMDIPVWYEIPAGNGARAVGYMDNKLGMMIPAAFTLTGVVYRGLTADASGSSTFEIRKNGTQISGTSLEITAANQWGYDSDIIITGLSVSLAAGDIIRPYISAVGTTPGNGFSAILIGKVTGTLT